MQPWLQNAIEIDARTPSPALDCVVRRRFSSDASRKIIDAVNAMPPQDVTYEAERFMIVIQDDGDLVAALSFTMAA